MLIDPNKNIIIFTVSLSIRKRSNVKNAIIPISVLNSLIKKLFLLN